MEAVMGKNGVSFEGMDAGADNKDKSVGIMGEKGMAELNFQDSQFNYVDSDGRFTKREIKTLCEISRWLTVIMGLENSNCELEYT